MPWSVSDVVDGVLDEGEYIFRITDVNRTAPKDGAEYGRMLVKMLVISDGPHTGKKITQGFPLEPKNLGLFGKFLQGTGEFPPGSEPIPDDEEEAAIFIRERIAGKEYTADYEINASKDGKRKFGNVTVTGPYNADFA